MISINGALSIDIQGQVVADTINGGQFSGIGGAEDFVAGAGLELSDRSLICLPSTFEKGGALQSRIVPWFGPGAVITTPRHQVDVVITEYGAAELEGRTVRERGEALAAIAHPQFRDALRSRPRVRRTVAHRSVEFSSVPRCCCSPTWRPAAPRCDT